MLTPYKWQEEAYESWKNNNYKGTIKAITGIGKTFIGLMAVSNFSLDVIIVVPNIHLMKQWKEFLIKYLNIDKDNIGFIYGVKKEFTKPIKIAVVNSIRELELKSELLIIDEVHRFASVKNFQFIDKGNFNKILCLSATPEREDERHRLILRIAPIVYNMNYDKAIKQNLLSKFDVVNVGVVLTFDELQELSIPEDFIRSNFEKFNYDFNDVKNSVRRGGLISMLAAELLKAFNKRKKILQNANNKIQATLQLIKQNQDKKIIVFSEFIDTANKLTELCKQNNINYVEYNSSMKDIEKEQAIEKFKNDDVKLMISVKCLDEGLDVPSADMAVVVAGSSVSRQAIQRLGRILRYRDNKIATLYQLYVRDSKDGEWLHKRSEVFRYYANNVRWI